MTLHKLTTESHNTGVEHSWHPTRQEALEMTAICATGDFNSILPIETVTLPFFILCPKRPLCNWLNKLTNPHRA
jgi:hypothetical protein